MVGSCQSATTLFPTSRQNFYRKIVIGVGRFYNVEMTTRRLEGALRTVAFACTLVVGIAVGCLWGAVELLEDKIRGGKRPVVEKSHTPPS